MFVRFLATLATLALCLAATACAPATRTVNDKIGLFVTPQAPNAKHFPVDYPRALDTLKGHARTVWILESWRNIEREDGKFDWTSLDARIDQAVARGFDVGIRLQVVLCGNDNKKRFIAVPIIPAFVDADMASDDFQSKAVRFYRAIAERYKGKARYLAVGNSVNSYFGRNPNQWEGFKKAYLAVVKAVHQADPRITILSDLEYGQEFYTDKTKLDPYLDFFAASGDDGFGFIFYFIDKVYYGAFENFTPGRLSAVLDEMRDRTRGRPTYILETSCFSKNPIDGTDMAEAQTCYVHMLLRAVIQRDELIGVSWWLLYDAEVHPDVPWDENASFGLFDSSGNPKLAWTIWKSLATMRKTNAHRWK